MALAGIPGKLEQYVAMKKSGLNTIELDVKDENGEVGWPVNVPLARRVGSAMRYYNPERAVAKIHAAGLYLIGRVVTFEDPVLSENGELRTKIRTQLRDPCSQVECSPNRPEGIVFVGCREAEDAHHRVSDVLLHLPAVSPQGTRRSLEVARLDIPEHFRIETLPKRSRADKVAEDDRDQRPPITRRRLAERESAAGAEKRASSAPRLPHDGQVRCRVTGLSIGRRQAARAVQPSPPRATAHASWLPTTPDRIPLGRGASVRPGSLLSA